MTDEIVIVYALTGLLTLMIIAVVPLVAWVKLGGNPEGTYRIFRVKYFSAIFIDAERTPQRFPLKSSRLKFGAPELPAYFEYKGFANGVGRYYLDPSNQTKHSGRMSQYYYPDNPFPIPILTMARDALMSAEKLEKEFNDTSVLDFLKVGKKEREKKSNTGRLLVIGFVAFVIFIILLSSGVKL